MMPVSPLGPVPLIAEPCVASRPGTYQSIQALRGIAAIMVAIFHAGMRADPTMGSFAVGKAGVDIFFVISGFVIWTVTSRRPSSPLVFLKHRFVRLVPMYWIMTLAIAAGAVLVPSAFPNMHIVPSDLVLSMLFVPHLSPVTGTLEPLLGQGWTLNLEVFFYLIFAPVLLLPLRARFGAIAAALAALTLLGAIVVTESVPPTWLLNPLLMEFLGGLCIARLAAGVWRPAVPWCWAAVVIGFAGLLMSSPAEGDDLARVLQYGVSAFLIVGGAVGLESAGRLRIPKWAQLLGAASYSIYLTHTFVISIVAKIWPAALPDWGFLALATVLAVLTGIVVYALVENPMLAVMRGKRLPTMATLFVTS
jgi:exopolysaccharide production protein ExoZ